MKFLFFSTNIVEVFLWSPSKPCHCNYAIFTYLPYKFVNPKHNPYYHTLHTLTRHPDPPSMATTTTSSDNEVYYMFKRTVVSTKPVEPNKSYQLSVLDRTMEPNHLRMVFYYRFTPSTASVEQAGRQLGAVTKLLRESLSEMLTWLPIATGRLVRDEKEHWTIKCNDAGVRLIEARAKGSVENWLKNVDRDKELKLIHWEEMSYRPYYWSTFYVQITEFEEEGLAIGLSCFHLLADPISATMFIRAWADTTLLGKLKAPPIVHPLPTRRLKNEQINLYQPYTHLINHYESSLNMSILAPNPEHKTLALSFTDRMVRACISMARVPGAQSEASPSPFEALAGLFWLCISRIKGIKEGLVSMSISLDMRKVLGLDKGYFGNCIVYNRVHAKGKINNKDGVIEASKAINEVVQDMNAEGAIMDLIEWLDRRDNKYHPSLNGNDLICANLETIEPYLSMFEDGCMPTRVSCYVEPVCGEGQVLILPSPPPSDGPLSRMVIVTLADHEAAKLCEDDLMLSFSPSVLMGINKNKA